MPVSALMAATKIGPKYTSIGDRSLLVLLFKPTCLENQIFDIQIIMNATTESKSPWQQIVEAEILAIFRNVEKSRNQQLINDINPLKAELEKLKTNSIWINYQLDKPTKDYILKISQGLLEFFQEPQNIEPISFFNLWKRGRLMAEQSSRVIELENLFTLFQQIINPTDLTVTIQSSIIFITQGEWLDVTFCLRWGDENCISHFSRRLQLEQIKNVKNQTLDGYQHQMTLSQLEGKVQNVKKLFKCEGLDKLILIKAFKSNQTIYISAKDSPFGYYICHAEKIQSHSNYSMPSQEGEVNFNKIYCCPTMKIYLAPNLYVQVNEAYTISKKSINSNDFFGEVPTIMVQRQDKNNLLSLAVYWEGNKIGEANLENMPAHRPFDLTQLVTKSLPLQLPIALASLQIIYDEMGFYCYQEEPDTLKYIPRISFQYSLRKSKGTNKTKLAIGLVFNDNQLIIMQTDFHDLWFPKNA